MDDEEKEYSVAREIAIVLLFGIFWGLIVLVASLGLIEIFKR